MDVSLWYAMADKAGVSHTYTNHLVAQPYPRVGNQRSPRTYTDHIRVCYDMLRWALSGSDLRGLPKILKTHYVWRVGRFQRRSPWLRNIDEALLMLKGARLGRKRARKPEDRRSIW